MDLDSHNLKGEDTEEIVSRLIDHVAKSDEEIADEREAKKPQTTELKVFIAENQGFELGILGQDIETLSHSESAIQYTIDFIDEHSFSEEPLNDYVSYVEITTPSYDRIDQFIFVFANLDLSLQRRTTEIRSRLDSLDTRHRRHHRRGICRPQGQGLVGRQFRRQPYLLQYSNRRDCAAERAEDPQVLT